MPRVHAKVLKRTHEVTHECTPNIEANSKYMAELHTRIVYIHTYKFTKRINSNCTVFGMTAGFYPNIRDEYSRLVILNTSVHSL